MTTADVDNDVDVWSVQVSCAVPLAQGLRAVSVTVKRHATVRQILNAVSDRYLRGTRHYDVEPYLFLDGSSSQAAISGLPLPLDLTLPDLGYAAAPPLVHLGGVGHEMYLRTFASPARVPIAWSHSATASDLIRTVAMRIKPFSLRNLRLILRKDQHPRHRRAGFSEPDCTFNVAKRAAPAPLSSSFDMHDYVVLPLQYSIRRTDSDREAMTALAASTCGTVMSSLGATRPTAALRAVVWLRTIEITTKLTYRFTSALGLSSLERRALPHLKPVSTCQNKPRSEVAGGLSSLTLGQMLDAVDALVEMSRQQWMKVSGWASESTDSAVGDGSDPAVDAEVPLLKVLYGSQSQQDVDAPTQPGGVEPLWLLEVSLRGTSVSTVDPYLEQLFTGPFDDDDEEL